MKYKEGYNYALESDYIRYTNIRPTGTIFIPGFVYLYKDGRLVLKAGYAWNGATLAPDNKYTLEASLVHDALYQLMGEGILALSWKDAADTELKNIIIEKGGWEIVANIFYFAVSKFGRYFINKARVLETL